VLRELSAQSDEVNDWFEAVGGRVGRVRYRTEPFPLQDGANHWSMQYAATSVWGASGVVMKSNSATILPTQAVADLVDMMDVGRKGGLGRLGGP